MLARPVVFTLYSVGALMALGTVAFSTFKVATNRRGPSGIPLAAIWIIFFCYPTIFSGFPGAKILSNMFFFIITFIVLEFFLYKHLRWMVCWFQKFVQHDEQRD